MALWENAISFEWRTNQRRQTKVPARRRHRGTAGAIAGRQAVSYGTPTELLRIPYGPSPNLPAHTWLVPRMYLASAWLEDGPGCDCFHQVPSFGKAERGRSSCATLQPVSGSLRQHGKRGVGRLAGLQIG